MLGAISIRLRQARLERERETHTHAEGEGRREGGGEGGRGAARMHMHSSPAPRTAHAAAPPARGVARREMRGGGWPAAPPGAAGALRCREPVPSPPLSSFCRRRPSNRSKPWEMAAQTCPLRPTFGVSPSPLPSPPLLQSRLLLFPYRTCPAYLPFTFFFLTANFCCLL